MLGAGDEIAVVQVVGSPHAQGEQAPAESERRVSVSSSPRASSDALVSEGLSARRLQAFW